MHFSIYIGILFITVHTPPVQETPHDPCQPSPCGPNSECRSLNGRPSCTCRQNYIGAPPNCRPECVVNTDCPSNSACISEKCRDPCPGSCGFNAECRVQNHLPICSCQQGYTGDPFTHCTVIIGMNITKILKLLNKIYW